MDKFQESFALMAHALRAQMTTMRAEPKVPIIKATARIKLDFAVKPITTADSSLVMKMVSACCLLT